MSLARKDDRHNEDQEKEILDSFNRAVGQRRSDDGEQPAPRFVVTGDKRDQRSDDDD